jgi:hypothetical protein
MSVAAIWKLLTSPIGKGLLIGVAVLIVVVALVEKGKSLARAEQAQAVLKAQERADKLANELVIEQAKKMAVTEKVTIEYRDRIRNAPDDVERLRAIALGMRDIASGRSSASPSGSPATVPASRADR